jgi:hypothetical protein
MWCVWEVSEKWFWLEHLKKETTWKALQVLMEGIYKGGA